jgi:hypothetical protein
MTTTTEETETTTIAHDPEAQAIENQLADTSVADLDIGEQALDVLVQLNINSVGKFLDKTNNGENPELIVKAGVPRDAADDILIAISNKREELKEAAKPKPKERELPPPSRGEHGYELTAPVTVGSVTTRGDGKSLSCRLTIDLAGEDGVVGVNPMRAIRTFCGAELDLEIRQGGGQESFDGMGPKPFHGVARTGGVSITADRKACGFTCVFVKSGVNSIALEAFAGLDAELRCTNNAGSEDTTEQDDDQLALDAA